jgi:predicted RNase H-like nuclease (RuvC/YqgF family)
LKAFYSEKNQEDKPPQTFLRKFSKSEDVNMKENLFQDKGSELYNNEINVNMTAPKNQLKTITVGYSEREIEQLEKQAGSCGTSLSQFIRIRSQMTETDIFELKDIISKQQAEIEELRIKLGFYNKSDVQSTKAVSNPMDGIHICLSKDQMDFLKEKFLESIDYDDDVTFALTDGSSTSNEAEYLRDMEGKYPAYIENMMEYYALEAFVQDIEKRLVENCGYDQGDFDEESLMDKLNCLEQKSVNNA